MRVLCQNNIFDVEPKNNDNNDHQYTPKILNFFFLTIRFFLTSPQTNFIISGVAEFSSMVVGMCVNFKTY